MARPIVEASLFDFVAQALEAVDKSMAQFGSSNRTPDPFPQGKGSRISRATAPTVSPLPFREGQRLAQASRGLGWLLAEQEFSKIDNLSSPCHCVKKNSFF